MSVFRGQIPKFARRGVLIRSSLRGSDPTFGSLGWYELVFPEQNEGDPARSPP